jgi:pimeloyl-ACP methyl ester carboxylesterase
MKATAINQFSIKLVIQKGIRIMSALLLTLLACLLIAVGVLWVYSPGTPKPFRDKNGKTLPGSISEKIHININGVRQGLFIKGIDTTKPLLLYLHGGMPEYFLEQRYPTGLENYFTVVWWEQRGSGLSFSSSISNETITPEQMISDTKEITNYLRKRFGKEKIYLMGHSGGTFIGIQTAAQAPELYYAYIGVAQMSDQLKSEKLAYEYMLHQFRVTGNAKMARKLEAAPVIAGNGISKAYRVLRDPVMHRLGIGTTHTMNSVITGIFLPSLACRDYTLIEKFNMWRGKSGSGISILWNKMAETDLSKKAPELTIPVYFIEGIYDYTCSYALAKEYFDKLHAPVKGFYTFSNSAHSPLFEEPEKMQHIIAQDALTGKNSLADIE